MRILFLAAILAPLALPAQTRHRSHVSLADVTPGTDLVARNKVTLHQGPGAWFQAAGTVESGRFVTVRSCDSGWCVLGGLGDYRYVAASDLEPLSQWIDAHRKARRHVVHRKAKSKTTQAVNQATPLAPTGQRSPVPSQPITSQPISSQPVSQQPVPQQPVMPVRPMTSRGKHISGHPAQNPGTPTMVAPAPVAPNLKPTRP